MNFLLKRKFFLMKKLCYGRGVLNIVLYGVGLGKFEEVLVLDYDFRDGMKRRRRK